MLTSSLRMSTINGAGCSTSSSSGSLTPAAEISLTGSESATAVTPPGPGDAAKPLNESPVDPALTQLGINDLFREARMHAPRCEKSNTPLKWLTLAQASHTLGIHKSVLGRWCSRGYIASVKGPGANDHRYVHWENILLFMADNMQSEHR